ncbi:phosphotransferase [Brevibacillus agri]|uniref:phosphotransferase n=1 Tax=Brevibacillus TaxID=55080 RepID=UPI0004001323|nr:MULTISPECIES: phosphotransferase [Brevibacillus]MBG9568928.1 spore coat protein [Brevibacillus agri]MCG5249738.1 phosphotransferase [Brevibacillus agri]MED1643188.1 phosphotransferase [Brevibacillus agri]MED1656090.1 phosphotransferase [Brevibacillus agri]MED1686225.1 phosphotransferase [Brevibacillus agri]
MDDLIRKIEQKYALTVIQHEKLRETPKSLVVFFDTSIGKFIGKVSYLPKERQHFILNAEAHLRKQGILIPGIQRTKNSKRYIIWKDNLFVLHQWLSWPKLAYNSPGKLEQVGALLGQFHKSSLGFTSKHGELYNGAKKWSEEYKTDLAALEKWEQRHADKQKPHFSTIVEYLPYFRQAGQTARKQLNTSAYFAKWKKAPLSKHFLCHGDFNNGNLLVRNKRIAIIDWEDVRYDFPSKDISRVLSLAMRKEGAWNKQLFAYLLRGYLRENPLSAEQLHLLFVDLAFPHIMERFLRMKQYEQMDAAHIQQFCTRESLKTAYMLDELKALA